MPGKKYTEESLVTLLKQKDKSAFSYLYDNYSGALYGIVLKILNRDEETAQDILQEAFVKIWKNLERFDAGKGTLFTWMLNITRNTAIDKLRSIKNISIQSIDNNVHIVDRHHQHEMGEDKIGLKDVVNKLKPEHKTMIDLAYYGGYTQEEISEKLKMPLGTVKTRARAALIELRKRIT
jgi:RNA polymerase sigma-70 factor (ECF subfamily)